MSIKSIVRLSLFMTLLMVFVPKAEISITDQVISVFKRKYGPDSTELIIQWRDIIESNTGVDNKQKLIIVNNFFNRNMLFVDDDKLWNQEDYWATPFEFIGKGAGDCEDFSIAKYFSLIKMGVSEKKLRMTYVKSLTLNQAHMVVTYYPEPDAVPLVLDNIKQEILPATQRNDLLPVYSFNGTGLWLARERGQGRRAGDSSRVSLWKNLLERIDNGISD